mgnify:CR=1 FL=1
MDEWKLLQLEEDEAEHNRQVTGDVKQHLDLASAAAALTLNCLVSLKDSPRINEAEGLVSLLIAKASRNVRFAVNGLRLGYYTGASAVLKAAYDALLYAVLFHSDPGEVAIWFRNELSNRPEGELNALRCEQRNKAKKALLDLEKSRSIKDTMHDFVDKANMRIHSNVLGLSEEFGIDMEYLMPSELGQIISESNEDFDKALERYAFLSSFGKNLLHEQARAEDSEEKQETLEIQLALKYDKDTLSDLSLFSFYIGHRLLEFTIHIFDIQDKEFIDQCAKWRKSIREMGETVE